MEYPPIVDSREKGSAIVSSPTFSNSSRYAVQPASYLYSDSYAGVRRGNNSWGSFGTLKCSQCRSRRKKCVYVESRSALPCQFCATRRLSGCIKEPTPRQKEQNVGKFPVVAQPPFTNISEWALYYETLCPDASPAQILSLVCAALQMLERRPAYVGQYALEEMTKRL